MLVGGVWPNPENNDCVVVAGVLKLKDGVVEVAPKPPPNEPNPVLVFVPENKLNFRK